MRYAIIIMSLVGLLSLIFFINIKDLLDDNHQQQQLENLHIKSHNISDRLDFYRKITHQLSLQSEIKDLVVFADTEQTQIWAQKTQLLIPDSIGLALFNEEGEILGKRSVLRVGKLCYQDIHKFIKGTAFNKPSVHRNNIELAHFDIFNNITSNNENIGVIFASFSLSVLQTLLDNLTENGQHLQLYTGDNELIVETNNFINKSPLDKTLQHTIKIPIDNSDWHLKASIEEQSSKDVLIYIALTNSILFILLCLLLFIFSKRLIEMFSSDFKTVHNLLISLHNNEINTDNIHSKLNETENIITDIKNIAEDISESQQQLMKFSQCDDLTGLLNRRGFYHESKRCIELAKRSIESTLIILDLDYFKQVNDKFGHAAGDIILKTLASCIKSSTRTIDVSARIGGDEFSVILVKYNHEQAITWYQDISDDFRYQQQKTNISSDTKLCSLSAGYATFETNDKDISDVMSRADKALYTAKEAGRANIKGYKIK